MILKMIWRNLWRNKRRTFITMASVMFAVLLSVVMKSLQEGVFDNLVKNLVSYYSGYIQVHKKGYWDERILDNLFESTPALEQKISREIAVTALVPRIESFALASSGKLSFGAMVTGVDPEKENRLSLLENRITKGHYFNGLNDNGALLGEGLAEKLRIGINDTIVLLGQGYQGNIAAGKYVVKGILHFGAPQLNQGSVYITLPVAQEWLSADNLLSAYVMGLDKAEHLEKETLKLRSSMGNAYEVMNWKEMMPEIDNHIRADTVNFYIYISVLYLIIAFGIFSTILMMTNERTYEFGLLISIGMKKWQLGLMMLGESFLLTIIGTAAGMALSLPVVRLLEKYPLRIGGGMATAYMKFGFEPIFPATTKPAIFISQAIIVLIVALLLGLYPVYYIQRLNPLKAMRK